MTEHTPFLEDPAWPRPPPVSRGVNFSEVIDSDDSFDSIPEDVMAAARVWLP